MVAFPQDIEKILAALVVYDGDVLFGGSGTVHWAFVLEVTRRILCICYVQIKVLSSGSDF